MRRERRAGGVADNAVAVACRDDDDVLGPSKAVEIFCLVVARAIVEIGKVHKHMYAQACEIVERGLEGVSGERFDSDGHGCDMAKGRTARRRACLHP
jgi:hypothetical protein